jgi:PAS domain S-box-containing protein
MAESPPARPPTGSAQQTEAQLHLAERRLAAHVENTPLVVIEWDHEVRVTRWNAQAERVFGWTAAEVMGKGLFECGFVLEENVELAQRMIAAGASGREPRSVVTTANRTKAGALVWCEWHNSVLSDDAGRLVSALSLGLDVTQQRATAHALSLSEARVRAALDGARMLAWDLDLRTNRWETTADVGDFYGIPAGPDYSNPELALQAAHPDDLPAVLAGRQHAIATGAPMRYEFRGRIPAPDGQPRWFSTSGQVLRDPAGAPVRIVAVTTDVTERKRSEDKFRALLESGPDALLIADARGTIELVNTRTEQLFGYDRAELLGRPVEDLVPGAFRGAPAALWADHPKGAPPDLAGVRKDGTAVPVEVGLSPLAVGTERYVICAVRDVTERKRAEDERAALNRQLQDAQRWESLGVLAGGVAHDFNNILTVVLGSAGLARRGLTPGSPAVGYLDQIEQACRRAADVCRQMLAYAGRTHGAGVRTHLGALVRESAPLLETPAARAAVHFDLDDRLPPIQADPAQVRQVLVNLVTNAAEATADRSGAVTVRAHAAEIPEGASDGTFPLAPPPGRFVVLTVSDTGSGMAPEVRARMFDPFYTTKFAGRGLGLAAVLGIVRAHKGGIQVTTAPDRGTTVSVYWPALPDTAPPVPDRNPRQAVSALVIDDEIFVREVTASTLEEIGFAPLLAADGPSGLELFHRHRDAIKLAVIDVMMPGMTGDQVLDAIRAICPTLPVVLVSGFADRRVIRAGLGTRTEFLQKPFHPEDLMAVVRRLV